MEDSKKAVKLAEENENFYATIGIHPVDKRDEIFNPQEFQKLINNNNLSAHDVQTGKIVGIGECGLDYY